MNPTEPTEVDPRELEDLLERIESGTIEDVGELDPRDVELLRRYYANEDDLQALFDRLRGADRDAR
jgi:hypothetical protein